jgi:hypothetical protein
VESPHIKPAGAGSSSLASGGGRGSAPALEQQGFLDSSSPQAFGVTELGQPQTNVRTGRLAKIASSIAAWSLLPSRRTLSALGTKAWPTPSRQKVPYVKESLFQREYKILLHYLRYVRAGRSGLGDIGEDKRGLSGYLRHKREVSRVPFASRRFKALADPNKIVLIPPHEIAHKLRYDLDIYFGDILDGEWDHQRAIHIMVSSKQRAMHERFVQNVPWEETELFKSVYAMRLARGERVRGTHNVRDLAREYGRRVDSLFESMKRDGFVSPTDSSGRPKTLPHVHIGRDGRLLFGNNGNHRLAIARIVGLNYIPCWVRGRHLKWQQLREGIAEASRINAPLPLPEHLADHPDLKDLIDVRTAKYSDR